jgi:hypothetical protein
MDDVNRSVSVIDCPKCKRTIWAHQQCPECYRRMIAEVMSEGAQNKVLAMAGLPPAKPKSLRKRP